MLKHSTAAETATASINRMWIFIGISPDFGPAYPFAALLRIDPYQNVATRMSAFAVADMTFCSAHVCF